MKPSTPPGRLRQPPRRLALRQVAAAAAVWALWGLCALLPGKALALEELRSVEHPRLGKVSLLVPVEWTLQRQFDDANQALVMRLQPSAPGLFDFEVVVAETATLRDEALNRRDLGAHVRAVLAPAVPKSVEGLVTLQRFGLRRDESLYARLTDRDPAPGEFQFITQGVRLQGRRAMLFTLYSNDVDGALLKRALDLVSSFAFEPMP